MNGFSHFSVGRDLYRWFLLSLVFLLALTILALTLRPGTILTVTSTLSQFLLMTAACILAGRNAIKRGGGSRQFWVFISSGYALWAINLAIWIYYHNWLRRDVPDNSIADIALFLHVVPLLAAAATRPYLKPSSQGIYRARVNFLVLLFFWVFLYAYFLFPYQYLFWNTVIYNARFNRLYYAENIALVLSVGGQIWFVKKPWRSIYFHLWVASFLYSVFSVVANSAIDAGRYYPGSLYDIPLVAAMSWYLLVPLRAWNSEPAEEESLSPTRETRMIIPFLARLAILAIPLVGVRELLRSDAPPGMQKFRLLVVLGSVLLLALCVLIKEFLTNREFSFLLLARGQLVRELQSALSRVKMLSGLLPICASCKKIRDGDGTWQHLETYIHEHSEAQFSHGICPDCGRELYGDRFPG